MAKSSRSGILQGISKAADIGLVAVVASIGDAVDKKDKEQAETHDAMVRYLSEAGEVDGRLVRRLVREQRSGPTLSDYTGAVSKEAVSEAGTSWLPAILGAVSVGLGLGASLLAWLFGSLIRDATDDLEVNYHRRASPHVSEENIREYLFLRDVGKEFGKLENRVWQDYQHARDDGQHSRSAFLPELHGNVVSAHKRTRDRFLEIAEKLME